MRISSYKLNRPGFTLVEVLVAAGLCMLIMAVLAGAFAAGIDTFSLLKSTGEMNDRLTLAKDVMTGDLSQTILEDDTGLPLRVSNVRYDAIGTQDPVVGRYAKPPARGFFRIIQETPSVYEGRDPSANLPQGDMIHSTQATNHTLQMTVRRTPDSPARAFSTRVPTNVWTSASTAGFNAAGTVEYPLDTTMPPPANIRSLGYRMQRECIGSLSGTAVGSDTVFSSPWAEVSYFLKDSGTRTTATPPRTTQPLFSLHRRIRLLTKNDRSLTELTWNAATQATHPGISCAPGTKAVNGPGDITNPNNRMGGLLGTRSTNGLADAANIDLVGAVVDPATGLMSGEDVLLTNVLSFELKASWDFGNYNASQGLNPNLIGGLSRDFGTGGSLKTDEAPFFDLPLFPSETPGSATFPTGTGNPNFGRVDRATLNQPNPGPPTPPPFNLPPTILGPTRRIFDTWTRASNTWDQPAIQRPPPPGPPTAPIFDPNPNFVPLPIRLKAIQIKLRIYDTKNHLTRQITFVQDL